jgi:hypothetical protein
VEEGSEAAVTFWNWLAEHWILALVILVILRTWADCMGAHIAQAMCRCCRKCHKCDDCGGVCRNCKPSKE